jgi:predicted secreted Zn-dependent protease
MKRIECSFILLVFVLVAFRPDARIPWRADSRLKWSDFKGSPPAGATNAAITSYHINMNMGYDSRKGFRYQVDCSFDQNRSWGKVRTDDVLRHEQGHFDIGEIYARKLRRRLSQFTYNPRTANRELTRIYDSITLACSKFQDVYDEETDFSRNAAQQKKWIGRIKGMIDSLPY